MAFSDFHCHLAFAANPYQIACDASQSNTCLFAVGVQPSEYLDLKTKVGSFSNVTVGLGLHPWWVPANEEELIAVLRCFDSLVDPVQQCNPVSCVQARGSCKKDCAAPSACGVLQEVAASDTVGKNVAQVASGAMGFFSVQDKSDSTGVFTTQETLGVVGETAAQNTIRFIGEVGLDFSPRWEETRDLQLLALRHIFSVIDNGEPKVISLHCVKAYDEMIDLLAQGSFSQRHACVFHWFSGSSEHLQKAISLGCYFSVGKRMLASKRGKEYAKTIPACRLLLETDEPFVSFSKKPSAYLGEEIGPVEYEFCELEQSLQESARVLIELKGPSVLEEMFYTSNRLFSCGS